MTPTSRSARLSLVHLEDRLTPASAIYSAMTQTLTVVAAQGDRLVVDSLANEPTGYIKVTETQANSTTFNSDATHQSVRNLVVRFGSVSSGAFTLNAAAILGGNLTVTGAKATQSFDLRGTVGGNVNYTATAGNVFDDVNIEASAAVGGNLLLGVGGGQNTVRLKGATINGNLAVTAGAGSDRVELTETDDIIVGGSATIGLGDGTNTVVGIALHQIQVGTSFNYTGGGGNDTFDLDGSGSGLSVGSDAKFTFGNPLVFDANTATFEAISAGRNVTFVGGIGSDSVTVSGAIIAGLNVTANLGDGTNSFTSNQLGVSASAIAGGFNYTGGTGGDTVSLDGTTIGKNIAIALGASSGDPQAVNIGTHGPAGVQVLGSVKVNGGSGSDVIVLRRMYVGNILSVTTGGGLDIVGLDDIDVAGATTIDLGAGTDTLRVETVSGDSGGNLDRPTTFGGTFTVKGGDGNDLVNLSDDADAGTFIHFGSRVFLMGGTGNDDTVQNTSDNIFEVTTNFNDFETTIGQSVP
jgi:hypothetical protein